MADNVYRVVEVVGTSADGLDPAIRNGIARAAKTMRNLDWFKVTEIRGHLSDDGIQHYQVGMKVGFRLDE